jgi:hypothetical protein
MLQNTVWRQYHEENDFREKLSEFCRMDTLEIIADDKILYGLLKSKLTKKELKLFAMDTAGIDDATMKKDFSCNDEELAQAKFKLYKKLKQDKIRLEFKETANKSF